MKLLIDIGNTTLKWATLHDNKLSKAQRLGHGEAELASQLNKHWRNLKKPDAILIACVGSEDVILQVEQWCEKRWKVVPERIHAQANQAGVTSAYHQPERLGVDRWLALIACHQRYPQDAIIISTGTAVTIDAITADGQHLGGLIIPGLDMMRSALIANTQGIRLEDRAPGSVSLLACDTEGAVIGGTLYTLVATIDRIVQDLEGSLNQKPALILTGGNAASLLPLLAHRYNHQQDLVIEGLAELARETA